MIADPDCCDARHSFAEAEAKIGDKQLSAQEGWFRSDKPIKKTQLYRYMLVLRNAEGRVRCFSPAHRTASSPGSYDLATDGYKVPLDKDDAWSEATSHFSKTSAEEASDGWAAQHVHELEQDVGTAVWEWNGAYEEASAKRAAAAVEGANPLESLVFDPWCYEETRSGQVLVGEGAETTAS